ncbi:PQQ-dependent sugar dehydrogenase [Rubripirellula amarantea]|uniref:PQQ-dependent sugar dehydrogenase n=1 Tax=Rubripirellula amarantea TaxID=2527999 RepID=UPI0013EF37BA|nr:PQQ-dependent sugar dehydrogenase [Rubripirellula amarantea]
MWTSSKLVGTPDPPLPFRVERVFPHLQFNEPIAMRDMPTGDPTAPVERRIVLERKGRLVTFEPVDDPTASDLAIDLETALADPANEDIASARDFVLDPRFDENRFLYVTWTVLPHETEGGTRVSRLTMGTDSPPTIDPASRLDILTYPSGDHIGTSLRFGPDGMLYVTTGDGARPFPPDKFKTAQDVTDLRGAVLRVDVRNATKSSPYQIPPDNPFVDYRTSDGRVARGEIYAIGLRNGFRSAFDPATNEFWVADVGWDRCEMIHKIAKGGNHGWSLYEGPFEIDLQQPHGPGCNEDGKPIIAPIILQRDEVQSVTGGVFVPANASIAGKLANQPFQIDGDYLFGCYMNGGVWAADVSQPSAPVVRKLAATGLRIIDFETIKLSSTPEGKLDVIIIDINNGGIYRLVPNEQKAQRDPFPTQLSDTGLFIDCQSLEPAPGIFAYSPAATMYRDGAIGQRVIGIPSEDPIRPSYWFPGTKYPQGTVLANTLTRKVFNDQNEIVNRRVETQLLVFDGLNWAPYSYVWNDEQNDAELVPAGGTEITLSVPDNLLGDEQGPAKREMLHTVYSRNQCMICHHGYNPGGIGFTPQQLHEPRSVDHPEVVTHWNDLVDSGITTRLNINEDTWWVDPYDETLDLDARARSYLAVNCSACHQMGGRASSAVNLQRNVPIDEMNIIGADPAQGNFGITGACVVKPGHPEQSVLMYRVATHGPGQMPKIGSGQPDIAGAKLLWDWIAAMKQEPTVDQHDSPLMKAMLDWRNVIDQGPAVGQAMAASVVSSTTDPTIVGLFEPWIEVSQRATRVGPNPDVAALLSIEGDAKRGEYWFAKAASAQCRNCHQVREGAVSVGPSLGGIGSRRTRAELLDQILNPSNVIEPRWRSHLALTFDGEIVTGLKVDESDDAITLRRSDGRDQTIAADDIETIKLLDQSLMPSGMCEAMTPTEVADLLSYLQSL